MDAKVAQAVHVPVGCQASTHSCPAPGHGIGRDAKGPPSSELYRVGTRPLNGQKSIWMILSLEDGAK